MREIGFASIGRSPCYVGVYLSHDHIRMRAWRQHYQIHTAMEGPLVCNLRFIRTLCLQEGKAEFTPDSVQTNMEMLGCHMDYFIWYSPNFHRCAQWNSKVTCHKHTPGEEWGPYAKSGFLTLNSALPLSCFFGAQNLEEKLIWEVKLKKFSDWCSLSLSLFVSLSPSHNSDSRDRLQE